MDSKSATSSTTSGRTRHDLVHPIPQRAYAFGWNDACGTMDEWWTAGGAARAHSVPWGGMDGLTRPTSAPGGLAVVERPTSPLCRVANPMVRDNHFRRGIAVGGDRVRLQSGLKTQNSNLQSE